ncbi:MAG: chain length-determining protein [Caulobacteraceae bacterium]|nr:chain length-determining protein [Caulobacteraceae bacterium]
MASTLTTLIYNETRRVWCYWRSGLAAAILLFTAAAGMILTLPDVYEAWGQVFVSSNTPVSAATQGVSLGSEYGSGAFVAKTLLNDQGLEKVMRRINPAAASMSAQELAAAARSLKAEIQVIPDQGDGFIEFRVKDRERLRAYAIVRALLDEFVSRNLGRNQREMRQAGEFLDGQIVSYQKMLAGSREQLVEYQRSHPGFAVASTAEAPAGAVELMEARAAFAAALAQAGGSPQVQTQSLNAAAVDAAKARLSALQPQFTDQHPDVIAARRQLEQAIAQRDAEPTQVGSVSGRVSNDPVLAGARRRLASAQAATSTRRAAPDPGVQAQLADLQKTDDVLRANYQQLIAKREAVRVSQAVSNSASKYQITREPTVPDFPIGPKRRLFMALAVLLSLGGGAGFAYLRAVIAGTFVSPRELESMFDLPVVGTVSWEPAWSTDGDRRRDRRAAIWAGVRRRVISKARAT